MQCESVNPLHVLFLLLIVLQANLVVAFYFFNIFFQILVLKIQFILIKSKISKPYMYVLQSYTFIGNFIVSQCRHHRKSLAWYCFKWQFVVERIKLIVIQGIKVLEIPVKWKLKKLVIIGPTWGLYRF